MKKTILFMALALGSICLTSCARGYGCPYTMDTKNQPVQPTLEKGETVEDLVMLSDEQDVFNNHLITK